MSPLETTVLVLVGLWLGALTLLVLLTVRQASLLTVRFDVALRSLRSPFDDGLAIGSDVPEGVEVLIPRMEDDGAAIYLLFLAASCESCRQIAAELGGVALRPNLVALVSGLDDEAERVAALLPSGVAVLRDPDASTVARGLRVDTRPFALGIEGHRITGKALLTGSSDLVRLIESERMVADERIPKALEVTRDGDRSRTA
jgi:hypothetical protein